MHLCPPLHNHQYQHLIHHHLHPHHHLHEGQLPIQDASQAMSATDLRVEPHLHTGSFLKDTQILVLKTKHNANHNQLVL